MALTCHQQGIENISCHQNHLCLCIIHPPSMESMQGSQLMFFGRRKNVESLWSRKPHRCLGDCESELVLLISFLVPTLALVEWQSIVTNPNQPLLKHPSQQGGYFETILCIGRDWCEHCDIVDHLGLGQLRGSALDWLHAACCFSLPSVPSLLPQPPNHTSHSSLSLPLSCTSAHT